MTFSRMAREINKRYWDIFNKLFGWDYVRIECDEGRSYFICRVKKTSFGEKYIKTPQCLCPIYFLSELDHEPLTWPKQTATVLSLVENENQFNR